MCTTQLFETNTICNILAAIARRVSGSMLIFAIEKYSDCLLAPSYLKYTFVFNTVWFHSPIEILVNHIYVQNNFIN